MQGAKMGWNTLAVDALEQATREGRDMAFKLELRKQRGGFRGGQAAARGERVRGTGIVAKRGEQRTRIRIERVADSCSLRRRCRQVQFLQDIAGTFHELGALLDQRVTTLGERRVNRAGNGKYFPALLGGEARRDERAAVRSGLHDQAAEREAADQAVAAREMGGEGARAKRKFGHQRTAVGEFMRESAMAGGVDDVGAGPEHRDAAGSAGKPAAVRRAVDAEREPTHHSQAGIGKRPGEGLGIGQTLRGRVAAPDNGERRPREQLARPLT